MEKRHNQAQQLARNETIVLQRKEAQNQRVEARRKCSENEILYGKMDSERVFTGRDTAITEVWRDGERVKEIKKRETEIATQRNELKTVKQQLRNQKKNAENDINLDLEYELLAVYQNYLNNEEKALQCDKERYGIEKTLHIREFKRIRSEDTSRFNDFLVLDGKYLLLNLIGKGGFSEVYQAYDVEKHTDVAVKIHHCQPEWSDTRILNYSKHALREYNIQQSLNHPRVVKFLGVFEIDESTFATVLEYCAGGDLDTYLKKHHSLPVREARVITAQIVEGLVYMHQQKQPIIHYDLKPGNILFTEFGRIKIADFGLSKQMNEELGDISLTSPGAGTYWYLPPECFGTVTRISPKVDVWSTGVILYQMIYGKKPFGEDMPQQKVYQNNVISLTSVVEFPATPKISNQLRDFIKLSLNPDVDKRPDIVQLSKHEWLRIGKSREDTTANPLPDDSST